MPEITAGVSRSEARARKEQKLLESIGSAGWRAAGVLHSHIQVGGGEEERDRSRSPTRTAADADRLAKTFVAATPAPSGENADAATEAAAAEKPAFIEQTPLQKAKAQQEKEREKARLKKLAREAEQQKAQKEKEAKQEQRASKAKHQRY
mmetsp:Transcript_58760/g.102821  ORF Transcript_58760/g.102821 Transcript_58760/m.102821 type:complete len:150 (-) Transcript_58760:92-541(-)